MSYDTVNVEKYELLLGKQADTIINIGTMVVHKNNTAATIFAMLDVGRLQTIAEQALLFNYVVNNRIPAYN